MDCNPLIELMANRFKRIVHGDSQAKLKINTEAQDENAIITLADAHRLLEDIRINPENYTNYARNWR